MAVDGCAKVKVLSILTSSARMSRTGVVPIKLRCDQKTTCAGTLKLATAGKVAVSKKHKKHKKHKKRKLKLGSKSFSIAAGKTRVVKMRLKRRGRRAVTKLRRLSTNVSTTIADVAIAKTIAVSKSSSKGRHRH